VLAYNSTDGIYKLLLLCHILSAIVGFGSTFVYMIVGRESERRKGLEAVTLSETSAKAEKVLTNPFILATGVFGFIIAATADEWSLGDGWISASLLLFVLSLLFSYGVHQPNVHKMNALVHELAAMGPPPEDAAPSGPPPQVAELERRGKLVKQYSGILHLALVAILVLMIWKPGA
jgi:uncharacterized membrane protein